MRTFVLLLLIILAAASSQTFNTNVNYIGAQVSNISLLQENGSSYFLGADGKTKCKWCELDCHASPILQCEYRYLRYGCHIEAYCLSLDATQDVEYHASFALCRMYNNCQIKKVVGKSDEKVYFGNRPSAPFEAAMNDAEREIANKCKKDQKSADCVNATQKKQALLDGKAAKEALYLNGQDGKRTTSFAHLQKRSILFKDMQARPSLYVYFKIIQDIKDMLASKTSYDAIRDYANSRLNNIPQWWRLKFGVGQLTTARINGIASQTQVGQGETKMDNILDRIKASLTLSMTNVREDVAKLNAEWLRSINDPYLDLDSLLFAPQSKTLCDKQDPLHADTISLFVFRTDIFLRHYSYNAIASKVAGDNNYILLSDGSWKKQSGLFMCAGVSFESVNFPRFFLRHFNFKLKLAQYDGTSSFEQDATFAEIRPGFGCQGDMTCVSYRSYNYPERHIVQSGNEFIIAPVTQSNMQYARFRYDLAASLKLKSSRCDERQVLGTYYFQSISQPDYYLYSGPFVLELRKLSEANQREDWESIHGTQQLNPLARFLFAKVKAIFKCLTDVYSLRPTTIDNEFVVHQDYRIKVLQYDGTDGFEKDAGWKIVPGLSPVEGKVTVSFESYSYPGFYITEDLANTKTSDGERAFTLTKMSNDPELLKRMTFIAESQDV